MTHGTSNRRASSDGSDGIRSGRLRRSGLARLAFHAEHHDTDLACDLDRALLHQPAAIPPTARTT